MSNGITLGIAISGLLLGVINLWRELQHDRLKLRVSPKGYFRDDGASSVCIEVINLSTFAVSVAAVGFVLRDRQQLFYTTQVLSVGKYASIFRRMMS